ncbi:MFS general substrate transporter [Guyanagaster necrorhizus]|uniref:MFS general substrate transporter n=1 Tax=Guyanagaster necrorhizus TaxID=856835 RepID=A0A9P7VLC4_9AGAR|nr:MFS general substrate transporter [Guyanagaster necrorhizus MCA 3950]KAG7443263.1 MFS general substrate transporter [Guyanagaster necrorhizus MCA 3950]
MSSEKGSSPSLPAKTSLEKDIERCDLIENSKDTAARAIDNFGDDATLPPPPALTEEQEKKLWRKIDLRLMPILSLMYLFSFLDRGNAKLQGLTTQLNLDGNKYNIALTMYFISYCIFECPANLVLKKFRPSRWLPVITVVWGIIMTLMGLVKNYPQLVGVRVCLGVAEAGFFPGVVYYLTLWYPRHQLQLRIGYFFGAASLAGAFSGLLAFAISFMSGTRGLLGWSWIFIIEGCATIAVGLLSFLILVDFPATAKFLTPEERAFVVWKKKYDNSSVGEEEHFSALHIIQALTDWQIFLHILIYMSIVGPLYGITLFLPFGHTTAISQLLTVPPYIFATILLYLFARLSDRLKMRSPFIYLGLGMLLVGFSINISDVAPGVKYFGTFFCVAGSYASYPGVVAWLGNNLAGQYKRGVGMAIHIGIGNFSGAIASNIYRTQDSPRFILGHALELMFVGIGIACVPAAVISYTRINANREKEMQKGMSYSQEELKKMGDRAPDFRYTI